MSAAAIERVSRIQWGVDLSEEEWQRQVEQHVGSLKERHRRYIQEAAAVAAYHAAVGYPVVRLLVVDDARQFKLLTEERGLCSCMRAAISSNWSRTSRSIGRWWRTSSNDFGTTTGSCWLTARGPGQPEAERLSGAFDQLFSSVTATRRSTKGIAQTQAKKAHLLMVLTHPEIPCTTTPRSWGRVRGCASATFGFGPRSATGAQCWDTFQTLYGTAKKLGVNFYEYICERVRGGASQLPELIASKALEVPLGASWDPAPDY